MKRRNFLRLCATSSLGLVGVPGAFATGDARGPACYWARLRFPGPGIPERGWRAEPPSDLLLIQAIRDRTSINLVQHWFVADVDKLESLIQFPFVFMHGNYAPTLTDAHRANLREYLVRGGFLFAEDCVNTEGVNDQFFQGMATVDFPRMFPEAKLERLPLSHPVFHCYYDLPRGLPHMQGVEHGLHGLTVNGRLIAFLSPSDIHCAWTNRDFAYGPGKQEAAFQMAINIYLFAMNQTGVIDPLPRPR